MARAFGRVDLTDGGEKFMIFRSRKDPEDEWMIVEDRGYVVRKFDRRSFEDAMQSLLE
jgi:DNA/RNA-binding domain of Phe-tRNA-synthetase-like protein